MTRNRSPMECGQARPAPFSNGYVSAAAVTALLLGVLTYTPSGADENGPSDADISASVAQEIIADSAVPFDKLDLTVESGVVTLTGTVDNLLAKERAVQLAETLRGVRAVIDRIAVRPKVKLSPERLRNDIRNALVFDPATESFKIDVEVGVDGRVTLRGLVQSWPERELAETVAKSVYGVTEVVNDIDVEFPVARTDEEIRRDIESRLRWDALIDHGLVDVEVNDGRVLLTGIVGSAAEKRQAARDAHVAGVSEVDHAGLEVARWTRDEDLRKDKYARKPDKEIVQAVNDALMMDPRVFSYDIRPSVKRGVVTLEGVVDNLKARVTAANDARHVVGVVDVKNDIKVEPITGRDDQEIADSIRAALARDVYIRHPIDVEVESGVVHLRGSVNGIFEKAQAEDIAYRARGVVSVRNRLDVDRGNGIVVYDPYVSDWYIYDYPWYSVVNSPPVKSDQQIKEDIVNQMSWSPFINTEQVEITVQDGVAILTGAVGSWGEYNTATENAYEGGAVGVENRLIVN